jgi:hypothetical protein
MKPRAFKLHIDDFGNARGRVWAVQTGGRYLTATRVDVQVPTTSVFCGRDHRQPKAYLWGVGVVHQRGAQIRITAQ